MATIMQSHMKKIYGKHTRGGGGEAGKTKNSKSNGNDQNENMFS